MQTFLDKSLKLCLVCGMPSVLGQWHHEIHKGCEAAQKVMAASLHVRLSLEQSRGTYFLEQSEAALSCCLT